MDEICVYTYFTSSSRICLNQGVFTLNDNVSQKSIPKRGGPWRDYWKLVVVPSTGLLRPLFTFTYVSYFPSYGSPKHWEDSCNSNKRNFFRLLPPLISDIHGPSRVSGAPRGGIASRTTVLQLTSWTRSGTPESQESGIRVKKGNEPRRRGPPLYITVLAQESRGSQLRCRESTNRNKTQSRRD